MYLTQPAVSLQLKKLQEQFREPLFEVVSRRIHITPFGYEIGLAAGKALELMESINHRSEGFEGKLSGRLRISVVSTGKYVLPYFLAPFIHQHPSINLSMDVTNKYKVVETLEHNEVDFSLVSVIPEHLSLERLDLLPNKLYLIGGRNDRGLAQPKKPADLEQHPLIYREEGSGTRLTMERFLVSCGVKQRKRLELTSNEAVKQAVIAGLGYSVMPLIGIKNELQNGDLRILPMKGLPLETTWSLVWPRGKKHAPTAAAFVQFLEAQKEGIVERDFGWQVALDT